MQYRYVAYHPQKGIRKGWIEASAQSEATAAIVRLGYKPLQVNLGMRPPSLESLFPSLFRVKGGEMARFSRQLATMIGSGVTLLRALEMLKKTTRDGIMRRTIVDLLKTLDDGGSLSSALGKHPRVFSPLFVSVVEVGESTGRLGQALEQISEMQVKEQEAKGKAMRALMYPLAVMGLSMITLAVLMTVALPALVNVFEQTGADIPLFTRIAILMADGLKEHFLLIFVSLLAAFVAFHLLQRNERVKFRLDMLKTKMPIFGSLTVLGEIARASRTMSMLLDSGVSVVNSLHLVTTGSKNLVIKRAFSEAEESLMSGHSLTEALKRHPVLPQMYVELVSIGEESNSLQKTMGDTGVAYQKQFDRSLEGLLGMLEPLSTLMIGGIVGFIAFSMFTPIYQGLKTIQ